MDVAGFQIQRRIGRGGMGEVFEAVRVGPGGFRKPVALKRLALDAAADGKAVQRFFAEARISARLEHANIVRVHDVLVVHDGHFIVMELLRGRNLAATRGALADLGPVPWWLVLSIAEQALAGLEYAHALRDDAGQPAGLVHRDLTPRNLFVCEDGHVKILDFGIAKLRQALTSTLTREGSLQGTLEFLAPEQARGETADARTDLYQLGGAMYWALSGEYPHGAGTAAEVVARVLHGTPRPLAELRPDLPEAVTALVARAMAAARADRFASASEMRAAVRDALAAAPEREPGAIAAALAKLPPAPEEAVLIEPAPPAPGSHAGGSTETALAATVSAEQARGRPSPGARARGPVLPRVAAITLLVAAVGAGAFFLGRRSGRLRSWNSTPAPPVVEPEYRRLTFRRGAVFGARFVDDKSFVYSATWSGNERDTYLGVTGNPEHRSLDLPGTEILDVSAAGELALLTQVKMFGHSRRGVLARAPLAGGAPRELTVDAEFADFAPGGDALAVVRWVNGKSRLEYPEGTVLHESTLGWIADPHVSPAGDLVAIVDHPFIGDDRGAVALVDRAGKVRKLSADYDTVQGLAWAPGGGELLFTAGKAGPRALRAVTLAGAERVIDQVPLTLTLLDVSPGGQLLVRTDFPELRVMADGVGARERELSWFHYSFVCDLSADGKAIVVCEGGSEAGASYSTYLRSTDGTGPVVRVSDGFAGGLSPDGKWIVGGNKQRDRLDLIPVGPGERRRLLGTELGHFATGNWLPGGREFFFLAARPGEDHRAYVLDVDTGAHRRIERDGITYVFGDMVSPDGKKVVLLDTASRQLVLIPLAAPGDARLVPGAKPGENFVSWAAGGDSLYLTTMGSIPLVVDRLDLATGERHPWRKIAPGDDTGVQAITALQITPDARTWAFTYYRNLTTLYAVEGAR